MIVDPRRLPCPAGNTFPVAGEAVLVAQASTQVEVGGEFRGQLVIGDHNVTVFAEQSVVTVIQPGRQPQPVRRDAIRLLPRRSGAPIGREQDLSALLSAVREQNLVQLFGPSGAGKSTVLRHAARELADSGTEVVFLSGLGQNHDDLLQQIFEACYSAPGYRPSTTELRRLMAGIEVHLVIDDLQQTDEQRTALLDAVPDTRVVFSSIERSLGAEGRSLPLAGLADEPALALLAAALGRELRADEQSVARDLLRLCDGLPLLLLRAVGGSGALVHATQVAELLPRVFGALSGPARAVLSAFGLADIPVISPIVLPWLTGDAVTLPAILLELTTSGLLVEDEFGYRLADGVALPPELVPGPAALERIVGGLLSWAGSPGLPPQLVAEHADLIGAAIDASVHVGMAALGARLAKLTAPFAACSLRMSAWERILGKGKVAAQRSGDRSILAYLTHEDGIRSLLTGKRIAAASALGIAAMLWHELGQSGHAAIAHQAQTLTGHAIGQAAGHALGGAVGHTAGQATGHAAGQATGHVTGQATGHAFGQTAGQATGHTVAHAVAGGAKVTGLGAKAGIGIGAKIAIVGAATVVVGGGGYFGVHALLPHQSPAAPQPKPVVAAAPLLTSDQLAQALLPQPDFPDNYSLQPAQPTGASASSIDLSTADCDTLALTMPLTTFAPGFGESAFATNSHASDPDRDSALFEDQAIYEFSSAAKASQFFTGMRQVLAACSKQDTGLPTSGPDQPSVNGHKAIGTNIIPLVKTAASVDLYGLTQPVYVLDGDYVYALATGAGRNQDTSDLSAMYSVIPTQFPTLISNVAALAKNPQSSPTTTTPAPTTTAPPAGPDGVVEQFYAAINAQNYQQAWSLGGDNFGESYDNFVGGYKGTTSDDLQIVSVSGSVVTVSITANQASGPPKHFAGTYTVSGGVITAHHIHNS